MANNVGTAFDLVLQSAVSASGTGSVMSVGGLAGVGLEVSGSFTATVTPKASIDGTFVGVQAYNLNTGAWVTTITAPGLFWVPLSGCDQFEAPVTWVSGVSVTVTAKGITAPPGVLPALTTKQSVQLTDGTTSQSMASAATFAAAQTAQGAATVTDPAEWVVTHAPVVNTAATATKAAGAAGVRHVARTVSGAVSADGAGAPTAVTLTLNLRDGASGAGTILATWTLGIEATVGRTTPFNFGPFHLMGTAATAMTLEFTAAGGAHTFESVTLTGFDVI